MRTTTINCDRCSKQYKDNCPEEGVTALNLTIEANGWARGHLLEHWDLCKDCCEQLTSAVRKFMEYKRP